MINQDVKEALNDKIQDGEFASEDIPAYLGLFCEMGNEIEDLQEEVEGWDRKIQFDLEGLGGFWVQIEGGKFTHGEGAVESPDLTLKMSADDAAQVFSGDKDAKAAYMSGALKVDGELPDAVRVQALVEIVVEEIEY